MGAVKRYLIRYISKLKSTFHNTHFSIKPVKYIFKTPMDISQIKYNISEKAGFFRNIRDYSAIMGYSKGSRITLFKLSFSARFLIMMRPFHGYMYRDKDSTVISGNFKFSISTKIVTLAWLLNDFIRLIDKLNEPITADILGHIVSLALLSTLLIRTVWKDKSQQQNVIEFVEKELDAYQIG